MGLLFLSFLLTNCMQHARVLIFLTFFALFSDRIGRSMPNLNKIRGQNKANVGLPQGSQLSHGRGHPTVAYGLSRQHTSDPRMQPPRSSAYPPPGAPARGAVMSRDVS